MRSRIFKITAAALRLNESFSFVMELVTARSRQFWKVKFIKSPKHLKASRKRTQACQRSRLLLSWSTRELNLKWSLKKVADSWIHSRAQYLTTRSHKKMVTISSLFQLTAGRVFRHRRIFKCYLTTYQSAIRSKSSLWFTNYAIYITTPQVA